MKTFKAFIKPFDAPQRGVKIKIQVNFLSSSGIGTERVKDVSWNYDHLVKISWTQFSPVALT